MDPPQQKFLPQKWDIASEICHSELAANKNLHHTFLCLNLVFRQKRETFYGSANALVGPRIIHQICCGSP